MYLHTKSSINHLNCLIFLRKLGLQLPGSHWEYCLQTQPRLLHGRFWQCRWLIDWLIGLMFYVPPDTKIFWRCSSQPVSWLSTERQCKGAVSACVYSRYLSHWRGRRGVALCPLECLSSGPNSSQFALDLSTKPVQWREIPAIAELCLLWKSRSVTLVVAGLLALWQASYAPASVAFVPICWWRICAVANSMGMCFTIWSFENLYFTRMNISGSRTSVSSNCEIFV